MKHRQSEGLRQIEREQAQRAPLAPEQEAHLNDVRPRCRAECVDMPRPCPFVGCRHHLFADVTEYGAIRYPHGPNDDVLTEMTETCSLDAAANGRQTIEAVAAILNTTRQRASQLEAVALQKLRDTMDRSAFANRQVALPDVAYSKSTLDEALDVFKLGGDPWLRRICS